MKRPYIFWCRTILLTIFACSVVCEAYHAAKKKMPDQRQETVAELKAAFVGIEYTLLCDLYRDNKGSCHEDSADSSRYVCRVE